MMHFLPPPPPIKGPAAAEILRDQSPITIIVTFDG